MTPIIAASRYFIPAAAFLAFTFPFQIESAEPSPVLSNAVELARSILRQEFAPKVPGVSVAVAVGGTIAWSEGFGFRDLAAKQPVTPETRFRIGSISKSLTSVGLALMVERGLLDLDAPVQKYVPGFPIRELPITTRLLGGHLAGIRHYVNDREMRLNQPFTNAHAALAIFQNDPLVATPGTKYHYSTYGWTLISAVMEAAAGEEFCRYMDEHVIQPLGMTRTRPDQKGVLDPDCTLFYESDAEGAFVVAPAVDSSYKWAGGGYLSTPEDLVRFGSALLEPGFLKADSLALLFTPQKTSDGKATEYGLGWRILQDAQGHRIIFHTGGSVGGTSVLMLHPETKTVFALTCNHSKTSLAAEDRDSIVELFAPLFTAPQSSSAGGS